MEQARRARAQKPEAAGEAAQGQVNLHHRKAGAKKDQAEGQAAAREKDRDSVRIKVPARAVARNKFYSEEIE
ncbi:MAG: hypothetical protein J7K30_06640 [Deltaproteobacteria bacterium]|nr:hypothetical protein [Deltaproteobacteria bacterium]